MRILLISLHFNKARSTRLTRYAAELTRRTEYKPAGLLYIVPIQPPGYAGPSPSALIQRAANSTATPVKIEVETPPYCGVKGIGYAGPEWEWPKRPHSLRIPRPRPANKEIIFTP